MNGTPPPTIQRYIYYECFYGVIFFVSAIMQHQEIPCSFCQLEHFLLKLKNQ